MHIFIRTRGTLASLQVHTHIMTLHINIISFSPFLFRNLRHAMKLPGRVSNPHTQRSIYVPLPGSLHMSLLFKLSPLQFIQNFVQLRYRFPIFTNTTV